MSDLFCAATLVVVRGGDDVALPDDVLRGFRVAAVWTSATVQETAESVVRRTGAALSVSADLDDQERLPTALEELADTFRGETVVVVGEEPLLEAVRAEALNGASLRMLAQGQSATAEVDADGLVLRRWGDRSLER